MQLESTLAQFPLSELIAMISHSSVTGVLDVGEVLPAQMFFRDGHLYHAVINDVVGVEAVCHVFTLVDSPFRFTAGVVQSQETIWQDTWEVVEFGERYAEMWHRVKQHIPSFEWVPVLCQPSSDAQVLISEMSWQTLAAVDGQRSIVAVADEIGQVPLEVASALCDLIVQGVVRVQPPPSSFLRKGRRDESHAAKHDNFFSRLMSAQPRADVSR